MKASRQTESGLAWIIAEIDAENSGLAPDEFTAEMVMAGSKAKSYDAVSASLRRRENRGELSSRLINLNGFRTRAYKRRTDK